MLLYIFLLVPVLVVRLISTCRIAEIITAIVRCPWAIVKSLPDRTIRPGDSSGYLHLWISLGFSGCAGKIRGRTRQEVIFGWPLRTRDIDYILGQGHSLVPLTSQHHLYVASSRFVSYHYTPTQLKHHSGPFTYLELPPFLIMKIQVFSSRREASFSVSAILHRVTNPVTLQRKPMAWCYNASRLRSRQFA
ncbi:hypothetical protein BDN72DRAFT_49840 [Pluteus cervinus]|uniref:Uncharacterized protein n=1 Tax=Pluteus cervinus TaxID=181527 RepID=A0ACD3B9L3_9AGAR|nr:hypothetical protein BDN72DRAFT_49840 [Pluteus cervinus]